MRLVGLADKDRIRLEHISEYRKLRLTFNVSSSLLLVSALVVRPNMLESHPAIAIAASVPLMLLMAISGLRISLYPCPYCERRLGWTPYYRTRCRCCNDLVDLNW